jgi:Flp pilus assembly protein TadB
MTANTWLLVGAALVCSGATGIAASWLVQLVAGKRPRRQGAEEERRQRLRDGCWLYRWLEPGVDALARWETNEQRRAELGLHLRQAAEPLPWMPAEFLTVCRIEGLLVGSPLAAGMALAELLALALPVGALVVWLWTRYRVGGVASRAAARMAAMRVRLPFAVDLLALQLEAGTTVSEGLAAVLQELVGHPLAEELEEIDRHVRGGKSPAEALGAASHLRGDADWEQVIQAIVWGEDMGTSLTRTFRTLARHMRSRASQWTEQAAAEAQVGLLYPTFLILGAGLLVIMGPFLLQALRLL